jgi:DNA-binding transcriptional LysR family regulator
MAYTNLDTDLLRTFAVAVEAGNFGRAAALVGRTASAVSLQIDRLEKLAGQKLFRRDRRSFALTSAGEQLLLYARRILAINDEAVSTLQIACKAETVRLGLPEDVARFWLPRVLKRFAAEMPGTTVEVRTDVGATLLAALGRGDLDLAVVFGNEDRPGALRICELPAAWVAAPHMSGFHPHGPVPLVLFSPPCFFRSMALEALESAGLPWRIVLISPSLSGQWAAVKAGLGLSIRVLPFVPPDLVILGRKNGLPPLPTAPLTLHAMSPSSDSVKALQRALLETSSTMRTRAHEKAASQPTDRGRTQVGIYRQ